MSSLFSKGYQAAIEGKELAQEKLPHIRIDIIDSRTVESGELLLVTGAARAISEGKDIDEVLELTHRLISRVTLLTGSETLFYRDKGGRIFQAKSWAEAQPTSAFRTIVEVDASTDGKTRPVTRVRTRKQMMKAMVDIAKQKSGGKPIHAAIVHANVPQDAEQLKALLLSQCQCDELYISELPGAIAVHNGEGLLDLGFYVTD
jgi:DegV family protein with EDD domain